MSEWKKVKLGELYEVHNGLSKGREFFGSGYPFLTFSTVFNNWFLPKELDSLVQSSDKERDACSIRKGDVFITRTSETMNELGMSSVALRDYPNATYNGFTKRLRPITDNVVPEYIGYYLRSPKFRGKFMTFSTMTTRASLANGDLLGMEVELPNKEIQKQIAQILFRYDSLIENYQRQIKLLEESAQRLYKEWFVDLNYPNHESDKIIDGVPEGWEKKKLSEIAYLKAGGDKPDIVSETKNLDCPIPIFSNGTSNEGLYGYTNKPDIREHSVTISARGSVGYTALRRKPFVPIIRLIAVVPKEIYVGYLYYYLKNTKFISNGAAQQQITIPMIRDMEIPIPPLNTLGSFKNIVEPRFSHIDKLKEQVNFLNEARDRLLPKLMSGEINVETAQSVTSGLRVRKVQTGSPQASD